MTPRSFVPADISVSTNHDASTLQVTKRCPGTTFDGLPMDLAIMFAASPAASSEVVVFSDLQPVLDDSTLLLSHRSASLAPMDSLLGPASTLAVSSRSIAPIAAIPVLPICLSTPTADSVAPAGLATCILSKWLTDLSDGRTQKSKRRQPTTRADSVTSLTKHLRWRVPTMVRSNDGNLVRLLPQKAALDPG